MLDERENKDPSEWSIPPKIRGGFPYFTPTNNWIGVALKVLDEYNNGKNDWIEKDKNKNEWTISYLGRSFAAARPICQKGGKFFNEMKNQKIYIKNTVKELMLIQI